jgi:hypothetical protein
MTQRHRLNRGGDRQAKRALHLADQARPENTELRREKDRRGTLQDGDHPLPEAAPRP